MKQNNHRQLLCAAALVLFAGYGCSDNEQQVADKAAETPEVSAPHSYAEVGEEDSDKAASPSLLSPDADSSGDIAAIREDASDAESETLQEPDVDDETAIRTQAEQYRKTKDAETRAMIVDEIGNINADDLIAVALFTEALHDKNSDVRLAAINQLSTSEAHEAVDGLIAALHDSNADVVLQAIDALTAKNDARIPGELSALLTHKNQDIRDAASDAIDSLQEE